MGHGENKLRTSEADACLILLKRTPRNKEEEAVVRELEKSIAETIDIGLLKLLIQAAISKAKSKKRKISSTNKQHKLEVPVTQQDYSSTNVVGLPKVLRRHRGTMLLIFSIVSIFFPYCVPLGIIAWVLGRIDLKDMDSGNMDPDGKGTTQAGMVLGIVSTLFWASFVILAILVMLFTDLPIIEVEK